MRLFLYSYGQLDGRCERLLTARRVLFVTGVSAQTVNKLKKAGVLTVEQALRCYPRKYQEFARFNAGMQAGTAVLVPGRVVSYLKAPYSRKVSFVFNFVLVWAID